MALGLADHVWTVEEFLHTPLLTPLARFDPSGPLAGAGGVAVAADPFAGGTGITHTSAGDDPTTAEHSTVVSTPTHSDSGRFAP
jgi:hypothetical protein